MCWESHPPLFPLTITWSLWVTSHFKGVNMTHLSPTTFALYDNESHSFFQILVRNHNSLPEVNKMSPLLMMCLFNIITQPTKVYNCTQHWYNLTEKNLHNHCCRISAPPPPIYFFLQNSKVLEELHHFENSCATAKLLTIVVRVGALLVAASYNPQHWKPSVTLMSLHSTCQLKLQLYFDWGNKSQKKISNII